MSPTLLSALISSGSAVLVVIFGLLTVGIVFVLGLTKVGDDAQVVALASSAAGVIGTVIGAYFGVQVGSSGRKEAEDGRHRESEKAQALAAVAPPEVAGPILRSFGNPGFQ